LVADRNCGTKLKAAGKKRKASNSRQTVETHSAISSTFNVAATTACMGTPPSSSHEEQNGCEQAGVNDAIPATDNEDESEIPDAQTVSKITAIDKRNVDGETSAERDLVSAGPSGCGEKGIETACVYRDLALPLVTDRNCGTILKAAGNKRGAGESRQTAERDFATATTSSVAAAAGCMMNPVLPSSCVASLRGNVVPHHDVHSNMIRVNQNVVVTSRAVLNVTLEDTDVNSDVEPSSSEENDDLSLCSPNEKRITIARALKHPNSGRRVWDKRHVCYYCGKENGKMDRHLKQCHAGEDEVSKALKLSRKCEERKLILQKLTRAGDYYHNIQVLSAGVGNLVLLRRPGSNSYDFEVKDFGPCPGCLGFVLCSELWRHGKNCKHVKRYAKVDTDGKRGSTQRYSRLLLSATLHDTISEDFTREVLSRMQEDDVKEAIMSDMTVIRLGMHIFEKHGSSQRRLAAESMRSLGRLLIQLRQTADRRLLLEDVLKPERYDDVIAAVKVVCQIGESQYRHPEFKTPSLALKLGHHLKKCANILRGEALRSRNTRMCDDAESFITLHELEWQNKISTHALSTLNERKHNKPELLPCTDDLVKLCQCQSARITQLTQAVVESPTPYVYQELAQQVLCRIIVFNKRRSGEASALLVNVYENRPKWHDASDSVSTGSLSPFEKRLCESLALVRIQGKCRRPVPILLTKEVIEAIDVLLKYRLAVGINDKNPYVFARVFGSSLDHLRGCDCVRIVCRQASLKNPDRICGTKLRKYVATVCQVFSLNDVEVDWLARHLGHDIRVHREYYRLHSATVELAKISKLLLAVEEGDASKWRGKSLDDIDLTPDELCEDLESDGEDHMNSESDVEPDTDNDCNNGSRASKAVGGRSADSGRKKSHSPSGPPAAEDPNSKQTHYSCFKRNLECSSYVLAADS
jgi:hypothetical protein